MKKYVVGLVSVLVALILLPAAGMSAEKSGKWWIMGTVTGRGIGNAVISVRLVRLDLPDDNYVVETSVNKYGQYAFSNPGHGLPPWDYRLVFYVGQQRVTEAGLDGIRPGGRVPPVSLRW
jgi:hypothetical protein